MLVRKHVRPPWHESFPPRDLVLSDDADAVAAWLASHVPPPKEADPSLSAREKQLACMSAQEYIAARKAGTVSCAEYVTALTKRAVYYKYMNQFMYWQNDPDQWERVLSQARALDSKAASDGMDTIGPLYGLPVPCKGTMATTDFNSSVGCGLLHNYKAKRDAAVVRLLRAANGIVMGKTNVPEFAAGWITANYANGRTLNPYDHRLTTGGSSGGSASAVASYICPLAFTEDTGGSTRHPAFQCQNFGYDPARNHLPNAGNPGMSFTNDQVGVNARSFEDVLVFDAALLGTGEAHAAAAEKAPPATSVRVGLPQYPFVEGRLEEYRISESLEGKYAAVIAALKRGAVPLIEEEWPDVESPHFGCRVNAVKEVLHGQVINGRHVDNFYGADRGMAFHSFSGQMATFVASYLEAPVSNVDLVADMMPLGGGLDTGGLHRREDMDLDESTFRYWIASQPNVVRVWNSFFDAHGADVIMTPPQFADAISYENAAARAVPIRRKQEAGGYAVNPCDIGDSNYLHYMAFKLIPIPKLIVPTGLDAEGRPTAMEFWGRAPPPEKLYDDEFMRTFDLDFLYAVRPLVEVIHADAELRRVDAALVADLFT